jgi:hypothetical protein
MCRSFGFISPKTLNFLAFQYFDFERTWWRLFQKRAVGTKFDIYVCITFQLKLKLLKNVDLLNKGNNKITELRVCMTRFLSNLKHVTS